MTRVFQNGTRPHLWCLEVGHAHDTGAFTPTPVSLYCISEKQQISIVSVLGSDVSAVLWIIVQLKFGLFIFNCKLVLNVPQNTHPNHQWSWPTRLRSRFALLAFSAQLFYYRSQNRLAIVTLLMDLLWVSNHTSSSGWLQFQRSFRFIAHRAIPKKLCCELCDSVSSARQIGRWRSPNNRCH